MKLREELRFSGKALSATVRRVADRWFVCVPVEVELPEPACENQAAVGIDLGVSPVIREARNSRGLAQQHFLRGRRNEPDAMAQHDAHGMASMALLAQLFARCLPYGLAQMETITSCRSRTVSIVGSLATPTATTPER